MRHSKLNPAFKRFQYLPHLLPGGCGNHACAAPRVTGTPAGQPFNYAIAAADREATLGLQAGGEGLRAGAV